MPQWEYRYIDIRARKQFSSLFEVVRVDDKTLKPPEPISSYLADLGLDGWELVAVTGGTLYFKRPKE